jgi:hypothetical protein
LQFSSSLFPSADIVFSSWMPPEQAFPPLDPELFLPSDGYGKTNSGDEQGVQFDARHPSFQAKQVSYSGVG